MIRSWDTDIVFHDKKDADLISKVCVLRMHHLRKGRCRSMRNSDSMNARMRNPAPAWVSGFSVSEEKLDELVC